MQILLLPFTCELQRQMLSIATTRHRQTQDAKVRVPDNASNDDKLALYGLFKQATVGDINTKKPGLFDQKGAST